MPTQYVFITYDEDYSNSNDRCGIFIKHGYKCYLAGKYSESYEYFERATQPQVINMGFFKSYDTFIDPENTEIILMDGQDRININKLKEHLWTRIYKREEEKVCCTIS